MKESKNTLVKPERVVTQNDDVGSNLEEEKRKENEYVDDGNRENDDNKNNNKKLRKYLSKSREALFDKVVQKHNNNSTSSNFKKYTFKNHRFRKTRMCESQISLISKSQEKLLLTGGETLNAPSRSIEKLYGLRSLSKSQEVLNLYKTGGLLTSQENLNLVSEIIKSRENLNVESQEEDTKEAGKYRKLMRATTADLGVLHSKTQPSRMDSYSSTTSLASFSTNLPDEDDDDDEEDDDDDDLIDYKEKFESSPVPTSSPKRDRRDDVTFTHPNNPVMKKIEKLEKQKKINEMKEEEEEEDEEPRFTVAQLVTAFNKHQEIVTKTSLEVTMSAQEKKMKIPNICLPYESQSSFPTGPKALRLFIPDIDLVSVPEKCFPNKYKMKFTSGNDKKKLQSPKSPDDYDILTLFPESPQSNKNYSNAEDFFTSTNHQKENNKKYGQKFIGSSNNQEKISASIPQRKNNSKPSSPIIDNKNEPLFKISDSHYKSDDVIKKRSPTPNRKIGINRSFERSPTVTRKSLTVEKSPLTQRKTTMQTSTRPFSNTKQDDYYHYHKKENSCSSNYKIVGIGEKNSTNRTNSSVSYKIEFDSPVVKRKFPIKPNLLVKGTISSNLKVRETVTRARK